MHNGGSRIVNHIIRCIGISNVLNRNDTHKEGKISRFTYWQSDVFCRSKVCCMVRLGQIIDDFVCVIAIFIVAVFVVILRRIVLRWI